MTVPSTAFSFSRNGFIQRVREVISIPREDAEELPDPMIIERANEVFGTQFIDYRFKSLFRRKITLPINRFSARIRGFYLLDEYVWITDVNRREERAVPIIYNASGISGTSYISQTKVIEKADPTPVLTTVHPFFLTLSYNNMPQFFDNTNFRFSDPSVGEKPSPRFEYDEVTSSVIVTGGEPLQEVKIAGFERMASDDVFFDGENFIFPEDITTAYGLTTFSVYGTIQPFNENDLDPFFANPLFFERLYLLTARQLLYFFSQIEDAPLYEKIESRIKENEKHLLSMTRASRDITQRRFHRRSADTKFREMYRGWF